MSIRFSNFLRSFNYSADKKKKCVLYHLTNFIDHPLKKTISSWRRLFLQEHSDTECSSDKDKDEFRHSCEIDPWGGWYRVDI